jgi:cytochrome c peroxidase
LSGLSCLETLLSTGGSIIEDKGRHGVTKLDKDAGSFKTPSLRNIAATSPYFHEGELDRLKDAVDFFIGGCNSNPNLDRNIHSLGSLTGKERVDLLAFLNSLTGDMPPNTGRTL